MQIYIHKNNQQLGPFTEAEIKAQLASGAISLQDHVWWQGQANWMPLGESALLASVGATAPGSAPAIPSPLPGTPASAYQGGGAPVTSQLAIWSLVCGCLSILCWPFTSVPAIILGHMGLSAIKKNPSIQGRGIALAGTIIGYIFTTIFALYLIGVVIFAFTMGNSVKEVFKTLNAQIAAAQAAQATNSADQTATPPDQTTKAPDQGTPVPASPDQSTNTPASSTPASAPSTNAPDSTTNAAPMTQ